MAAGVNDPRGVHMGGTGIQAVKETVDMPVDKVIRRYFFNKAVEALKSTVTGVFFVVDMPGSGMGDHHMDGLFAPDFKGHPKNYFFHLCLGILVGTAIVPHGALKTQNIEAADGDHPAVDIFTSHGVIRTVTDIVVPLDIVQGGIHPLLDHGNVFWR